MFVCGLLLCTWGVQQFVGRETLETITFPLAVVAIVFAALQFLDSRAQEVKMNALVEEMSTRFIGQFPKNLSDILQVAKQANDHFEAMSDYVSYGYFSNPDVFDDLVRQLEDLVKRKVQVRMLIYAQDLAKQSYSKQFTLEWFEDSLKKKASPLFRFCQRFDKPLYESLMKWEKYQDSQQLRRDFEALMFDRQMFYLKDLIERGVTVRKTKARLPFFFWCEDSHEAIFAFLHEGVPVPPGAEGLTEVSFRTRDSSLVILTFEPTFNQLWAEAEPVELVGDSRRPDW
jgi:hypothetical protein